jgi:hypothetical protein
MNPFFSPIPKDQAYTKRKKKGREKKKKSNQKQEC